MPVSVLSVDDAGLTLSSADEVILDVLFDGRRIWSFWLLRDSRPKGSNRRIAWAASLEKFLDGQTRLGVVEHLSGRVLYDEEIRFGSGTGRIAVVNDEGKPLGIDKSGRMAQTFDTRSEEHVAPLLDSIEEVLAALAEAGIEAFPAYGTLLGAVREQHLIGHDSDADLGYVSRHGHPLDVIRESFRLQRRLAERGYRITRYSGIAFKVDVVEGDGSVRGLDVFGGFLSHGSLYLMGEVGTPFQREWIFPLGTCTLEGRTLPGAGRAGPAARGDVRPGLEGARPGLPLRDLAARPCAGSTAGSAAPGSSGTTGSAATAAAATGFPTSRPSGLARVRRRAGGRAGTDRGRRRRPRRRRALVRAAGCLRDRATTTCRPRRARCSVVRRREASTSPCAGSTSSSGGPPSPRAPGWRTSPDRARWWRGTSPTPPRGSAATRCGASRRWRCATAAGSTRSTGSRVVTSARCCGVSGPSTVRAELIGHGADIVHEETFDAPGEPGRRIGRTVAQWRT